MMIRFDTLLFCDCVDLLQHGLTVAMFSFQQATHACLS